MATHRTHPDNWLIPGALAFLVVAVIFAVVMLTWHGGVGSDPAAGAVGDAPGTTAASLSASAPATPKPSSTPAKPASPTPARTVVTIRGAQTGLCLGVADTDNEAAVVTAKCTGKDRQQWRQVRAPGGAVSLVNVASGKCMDVYKGSTDDGAKVVLWPCNGGTNQQWRPTQSGNSVSLVSAGSGKCLDVPGRSEKAGARLQQYTCNGTPAQHWILS